MKPRKPKPVTDKRETLLRHNLTAEEYKTLSAADSAEVPSGQTPKPRKTQAAKPLPVNWLLGCSKQELDTFELARLAEVADLRKELLAILDRVIDAMSQAALVAWFKEQDRQSLKHAIENEETAEEWAKRMIRDGQRSESELVPRISVAVSASARSMAYQERQIAKGLCSVCPKPLDQNSVRYCTKHLAAQRTKSARRRGVKGEPGSRDYLYGETSSGPQGRTPGTLASLAMNREKKTRALLAELGVKPESAAVTLNASLEALQAIMPRARAQAMTQSELRQAAMVPSKQTCVKALARLLKAGEIQRIGKGIKGKEYRYWDKKVGGAS
jgi:hypothetical protein